ncbi:MAG TPA: hypothetical protein VEO18_05985 [Thermoplasmata archaeon]|nr:hypothetical protein [Thermoplasmata archaeon]
MTEDRKREWRAPSRVELRSLAPRPDPHGFLGLIVAVPLIDGDPSVVIEPIRKAIESAGGRVIFVRATRSPLTIIPKPRRKR